MSADAEGWQSLPPRARTLFLLTDAAGWGLLAVPAIILAGVLLERPLPAMPVAFAALVILPAWGVWMALRRFRYARWLIDGTGLGYRRGRMWQVETRVPRTRVQHVDLKRGPLERHFGLATLVVHTAGTRDRAVAVAGLDAEDASRLRDTLARQIDQDDDDHAAG
ncbi:PH domain-containing protein [Luteimonas sp. MC1750]|uniref:PH domain-containing protein n=1 Tax=Luteimonas sp. MC1750 TaxID=2799326 RepID=UPI0018F0CC69|nr:PH domain-containing protein [Luteimonas sp. MC1750]MBJ6985028.1 PH domain-containing protein [Luteimonas sp. MC1750]QQO05696.1 PH domain-containing protein [Luteimonas sp. MC1750]